MADQKSVFQPLDPKALEGPFSSALQPSQGQQQSSQQGPPLMAGKATSIGFIAKKFLDGAAEGRLKAFQQKEAEKAQNRAVLENYVSTVVNDPTLTNKAKQYAMQKYSAALGADVLGNMDGGAGKGKKGQKQSPDTYPSKDGKVLKTGNASAQAEGPDIMGHFTNILRDVATGMTGGKMPKGMPDLNPHEMIGSIYSEISKPEYSVTGIVQNNQNDLREKLDKLPPGSTLSDAMKVAGQHLSAIDEVDPTAGRTIRADLASRFQAEPEYGSNAYWAKEYSKGQASKSAEDKPGAPPSGPPLMSKEPVPASMVVGSTPINKQQVSPQSSSAGIPQGPQGRVIDPQRWFFAQQAGFAEKSRPMEYTENGKLVRKQLHEVHTPDGVNGWFDASGREVNAPDVRAASVTEPRPDRVQFKDNLPAPKGQSGSYSGYVNLDTNEIRYVGKTPIRPGTQSNARPFDPNQHPQVIAVQNRLKATDALSRIINQTGLPTYSPGTRNPLSPRDAVSEYMKALNGPYANDQEVQKYKYDIIKLLDEMAKRETFKDKKSALEILGAMGEKTQGELNQTKADVRLQNIEQHSNDLLQQMLSGSAGGGVNLDELDR